MGLAPLAAAKTGENPPNSGFVREMQVHSQLRVESLNCC
jgi:hypothetical protein